MPNTQTLMKKQCQIDRAYKIKHYFCKLFQRRSNNPIKSDWQINYNLTHLHFIFSFTTNSSNEK